VKPYVVRQGEYLQQIAHRMGFDADAVWNAPENEALRKERSHPNILAACDILYVPEPKPPRSFKLEVGAVNTFVADTPKVTVSVKLAIDGKPCANEPYTVTDGGLPASGTTGGDGLVSFSVPITTAKVTVVLASKSIHYPVLIGHLDPIATDSGIRQRLSHLGFLRGGADSGDPVATAISQFQATQALPVTGEIDDATRDALAAAHGS
jgi:Putative peptidoglycan binding domain